MSIIFDNYIYILETPIILPRSFSHSVLILHFGFDSVSASVRIRPPFRSRALDGVSSQGPALNSSGETLDPQTQDAVLTSPQNECCISIIFVCLFSFEYLNF